MKRKLAGLLLALSMAVGCNGNAVSNLIEKDTQSEPETMVDTQTTVSSESKSNAADMITNVVAMNRPSLLGTALSNVDEPVTGTLTSYSLNSDLSNLLPSPYLKVFDSNESLRNKLAENLFVVNASWGAYEFYEVYESNKYAEGANFITTDSVLHTFHLYYAYLQKNVEQQYLCEALTEMSEALYRESSSQFETLRGSEWEEAAARNMDFFAVGIYLSGGDVSLTSRAQQEVQNIDGQTQAISPLFTTSSRTYEQDYSQFIPRGYYTETEELKQYFRTMMWYGQMNFGVNDESLNRSAILAVDAIHDAAEDSWSKVYSTTAFFAGESDDNGYSEYYPISEAAFGVGHTAADLIGNQSGYEAFAEAASALGKPKINSILVYETEDRDEVTTGFRVLGQRFTLDGYIMQRLIYSDLEAADDGSKRMMPDALDVPAALGSDTALTILKTTTDVDTWDYTKTILELRQEIEEKSDELYGSSIRSGWLGTLTPLLESGREGDPAFTQSSAWATRKLNTFLGNYAELKHDTVLYDKQVIAEMGATGMMVTYDTRGYVETEPTVFAKLAALSEATTKGLDTYGMIAEEDKENMYLLTDMCNRLKEMAVKELHGQLLTDEEYDYIRNFGGELEHFWIRTVGTGSNGYHYRTFEKPASIIVDIATNGEAGTCLEIGTGDALTMYVAVEFDGAIHLCSGPVFSFYQFEQPSSQRFTDEEWSEWYLRPDLPTWYSAFAVGDRISSGETSTSTAVSAEDNGVLGYAYVLVERLNSRSMPSADSEKMGKVDRYSTWPVYEIIQAEGYTWYRVDDERWIADKDGEWVEFTNR